MKCPSCAVEVGADAVECPACGVIFSKWREARKKEVAEAAAALEKPSPSVDPDAHKKALTAAIAVAVGWMIFLAVYYQRSLSRIKRTLPAPQRHLPAPLPALTAEPAAPVVPAAPPAAEPASP